MPDHTYLNLHDQCITLIDMKLHAQNQLCNSFSFRDLQGLIASFNSTHLKFYHQFVALIDIYLHA